MSVKVIGLTNEFGTSGGTTVVDTSSSGMVAGGLQMMPSTVYDLPIFEMFAVNRRNAFIDPEGNRSDQFWIIVTGERGSGGMSIAHRAYGITGSTGGSDRTDSTNAPAISQFTKATAVSNIFTVPDTQTVSFFSSALGFTKMISKILSGSFDFGAHGLDLVMRLNGSIIASLDDIEVNDIKMLFEFQFTNNTGASVDVTPGAASLELLIKNW